MSARPAVIAATALMLLGGTIAAQSVDPALTAAIAARDKAGIERDAAAMAKYTSDDYASINPTGSRMTKQQRVDGLKTPATPGAAPGTPLRTEAIHMYGTNAAVARMKGNGNRQLQVWIKNPSGWQNVSIHVVPDAFLTNPRRVDPPKTPMLGTWAPPAGLSGDAATVFAAHKQIQEAVDRGDRATYDKFLAPEFVRLFPGLLRVYTENSAGFSQLRVPPKNSHLTVQVWDPLAVVRWHEANAAGQQQWLTRVFAKKGTGWQQVAMASSAAANPPIQP